MRFLPSPGAIILAYHSIRPFQETYPVLQEMTVEPEVFERQILYLKKTYKIVSLNELRCSFEAKSKDLSRMAAISFDDAYIDNYTYAFPVLNKHRLPATVFAPTAFIESGRIFWWNRLAYMLTNTKKQEFPLKFKDMEYNFRLGGAGSINKTFYAIAHLLKYSQEREQEELLGSLSGLLVVKGDKILPQTLTWAQMKEMSDNGIYFGAHTHSHQPLSLLTEARFQEELSKPKDILEGKLGVKVDDFSYPYGEETDFSAISVNAVRRAGYKAALTMVQRLVSIDESVFLLPRIAIGGNDNSARFRLKLAGLIPLFQRK